MFFTRSERRLLALIALLLSTGFLMTLLRELSILPHPAPAPTRPSQVDDSAYAGGSCLASRSSLFVEGFLDVNRADSLSLVALPGIGPTLASRILQTRRTLGGFRSVEQLSAVPGIGPQRLAHLRQLVTAGEVCKSH